MTTAAENYRILRQTDESAADFKFSLEVGPTFAAIYILKLFLLGSGLFSILASILHEARWGVRLIKVANFFSTLLYCGIILIICYNWNPSSFRSEDKFGNIGLSGMTYLYCGIAQFAMVAWNKKLIKLLQSNILRKEEKSKENMKTNLTLEGVK